MTRTFSHDKTGGPIWEWRSRWTPRCWGDSVPCRDRSDPRRLLWDPQWCRGLPGCTEPGCDPWSRRGAGTGHHLGQNSKQTNRLIVNPVMLTSQLTWYFGFSRSCSITLLALLGKVAMLWATRYWVLVQLGGQKHEAPVSSPALVLSVTSPPLGSRAERMFLLDIRHFQPWQTTGQYRSN